MPQPTISDKVSKLINDLLAAEKAENDAKANLAMVKAALIEFHKVTGGTVPLENDTAKVSVYDTNGSSLDTAAVRKLLGDERYQSLMKPNKSSKAVRLTLKKT